MATNPSFLDLHKEADVKESIDYLDKFISRSEFQWQSVKSTTQQSERGKNINYNKQRGVNLHLFIRKYREIDSKTEPYIYIGKGLIIQLPSLKLMISNRC